MDAALFAECQQLWNSISESHNEAWRAYEENRAKRLGLTIEALRALDRAEAQEDRTKPVALSVP